MMLMLSAFHLGLCFLPRPVLWSVQWIHIPLGLIPLWILRFGFRSRADSHRWFLTVPRPLLRLGCLPLVPKKPDPTQCRLRLSLLQPRHQWGLGFLQLEQLRLSPCHLQRWVPSLRLVQMILTEYLPFRPLLCHALHRCHPSQEESHSMHSQGFAPPNLCSPSESRRRPSPRAGYFQLDFHSHRHGFPVVIRGVKRFPLMLHPRQHVFRG
mmetsp:Transcript_0/g.3  ORF Transcript_0/g.3 Transcript_0/m.3 type:complete len:210 (-) Transcript_0:1310-1939(-)